MIVRVQFGEQLTVLFGTSYQTWFEQLDEFMKKFAYKLEKPTKVEKSNSMWITFGGLKWSAEKNFQDELDREGKGRKYESMKFAEVPDNVYEEVLKKYLISKRIEKIKRLHPFDYELYKQGKLEIEFD